MENTRTRRGIAEVTEQAYARRHGADEESRYHWWNMKPKIVVMTIICLIVSSLILYWFVSSLLEHRRAQRDDISDNWINSKPSYLRGLSNNVLLLEYTLKILPMLDETNFTAIGEMQIQLSCKVPTKHIRLHAHGLEVKEINLREFYSLNNSRIISKYVLPIDDFLDIYFLQLLISGQTYILEIKYRFQLNEEPRGLFRSKYIDHETNEIRWIAISNFSPDYARRAFPCFDEPWIKAPFRISIGRRSAMQSHSNSMRKVTVEINDMPGYVWDHYEKTLPMSTYVVAIMVTDFSSYKLNAIERPSHTIFARKEVISDTQFVAQLIPSILRTIQNLTAFHYELEKMDVIVVPTLAYSAMENWGLLTFREDYILIKKGIDNEDRKLSFANIAAHEVAHQWFGNLVTPDWWSNVWLKEGFSSFFGNLALSIINPSWKLENAFAIEIRDILESSSTEFAHPLHINLNSIKRLDGVFDETSYVKGNCVIHMIFHFLGKMTFLSAVHRYMRSFYYRSADQEDLWNVFQEEIDRQKSLPVGLTMRNIMRTWTDQAGYPILRVIRNEDAGTVSLTQDRFYSHGLSGTRKERWYIPLSWTTESEQQFNDTLPKAWMIDEKMNINSTELRAAIFNRQWIIFNINRSGLYRVNYDKENWNLLIKSFKSLPHTTKVQLLNDAFAIANAGLIDQTVPWSILENLEFETDELLWNTVNIALSTVEHALWDLEEFKFVMCKLLSNTYAVKASNLLKSTPDFWTEFKVQMIRLACSMGHKTCLEQVEHLGEMMLHDDSFKFIPEQYRTGIYCTYMSVVSEEQWLALLKRYNDSETYDKKSLAYALGCYNNVTLLTRYLTMMTSGNNTGEKYLHSALESVLNNPIGTEIGAKFFADYWNKIRENGEKLMIQHDQAIDAVTEVLHALASYMDAEENVEWLKRLRGVNDDYGIIIDEVINRVQSNVAWNKKHKNEAVKVLKGISEKYTESRECGKRMAKEMH